jgi:hypothetical protein
MEYGRQVKGKGRERKLEGRTEGIRNHQNQLLIKTDKAEDRKEAGGFDTVCRKYRYHHWLYRDLNSGPSTFLTGALPLEPHPSPFSSLVLFQIGSHFFPGLASGQESPNFCLPSS